MAFLNSAFEFSELDNSFYSNVEISYITNLILYIQYCSTLNIYSRNLLGEDLGPLNTKELEQLERQLESSLKQVRSTKVANLKEF